LVENANRCYNFFVLMLSFSEEEGLNNLEQSEL